jgi:hypothetical protein
MKFAVRQRLACLGNILAQKNKKCATLAVQQRSQASTLQAAVSNLQQKEKTR